MPGIIAALNRDQDNSSNLPRIISIILLIVIAIAIAVALARSREDNRGHRAILPDGSTVEFLGTAVGGAQFTTDSQWQRYARRYLPAYFQNWIPMPVTGNCSWGPNSMTVYIRLSHASPTSVTSPPWQGYTTEDDGGMSYPGEGGYCSFGSNPTSIIYGLSLRAYPRRQKKFLLQLLGANGAVIASLLVPNPVKGPFSEWKPAPLPQTSSNGPVTLTLQGLEQVGEGQRGYLNPHWVLAASDPAWAKARERFWMVDDATGNEGPVLSRREPAWKLRTLVFRQHPEDLATNQLALTNIALPTAGNFVPVDQSNVCAGVGINVMVLAGPGSFGLSNGVTRFMLPPSQGTGGHSTSSGYGGSVETWGDSNPFLLIEVSNAQADDEIVFHVHDDQGREVKVQSTGGWDSQPGGIRMYKPDFTPSADTKSVSIQVVVNRPLPFEFFVNPADVRVTKP